MLARRPIAWSLFKRPEYAALVPESDHLERCKKNGVQVKATILLDLASKC